MPNKDRNSDIIKVFSSFNPISRLLFYFEHAKNEGQEKLIENLIKKEDYSSTKKSRKKFQIFPGLYNYKKNILALNDNH